MTAGEAEWLTECVVTQTEAGQRVDHVLRAHLAEQPQLAHTTRSTLLAWFGSRRICINGRPVAKGRPVTLGDRIQVRHASPVHPTAFTLDVRYESEQLLVVHKPAGMPSVQLESRPHFALSHAITARYPDLADVGYGKNNAGLVHRLDNDTSGLLLVARNRNCFNELVAGLREGGLQKQYLALTQTPPTPARGRITAALGPHPGNPRKVITLGEGGRASATTYQVIAEHAQLAVVQLSVSAAYRHQVRVHLASVGCPLLGDTLYGGAAWPELTRHALHASQIEWPGGNYVPAFCVRAALPLDLARVLTEVGLSLPPEYSNHVRT